MVLSHEKQSGYRADIDGLRSIAVLAVFVFHLWPNVLPGGYLGVDVFFVISGYLITGIIVRENRDGTFRFIHFYARRVKRIFPALFFIVALTAVIAILLLTPETYVNYMKSARYTAAQMANFFFARAVDYFAEGFSGQPLLHAWSLGVEEQFYLVWPVLIYLSYTLTRKQLYAGRHKKSGFSGFGQQSDYSITRRCYFILILTAIASATTCYLLAISHHKLSFYMFYSRAFEFCFGGMLAVNLAGKKPRKDSHQVCGFVGFCLLVFSFLYIGEEFLGVSFLQFGVLVPCIGATLLIYAGPESSGVHRVLAAKIPVFIGRISYSLYLVHWPIIIFWKKMFNQSVFGVVDGFVIIVASFIAATLMYFWLELPARKSGLEDRLVLGLALVMIGFFAMAFRFLENQDTAPWRVVAYEQKKNMPSQHAPDCTVVNQGRITFYQCQAQDVATTPVLALVGDSHSVNYIRPVTAWASRNGYNVKHLGSPGCPMLVGDVRLLSTMGANHELECAEALPLFRHKIIPDPQIKMVFIAQRFDLVYDGINYLRTIRELTFRKKNGAPVADHTAYYEAHLQETVEALRRNGKQVVLLKQVPIFFNNTACDWQPLLRKWLSLERECAFDQSFIEKWQAPSIAFIDKFATAHDVEVFDPVMFIDTPLVDGKNMYRDRDHITSIGATYITPFFDREMTRIMARINAAEKGVQNQFDRQ